jgi:hypothetical protein
MNVVERNAWTAFKNVVEKLLGNHKDEDYENIVRIMFKNFHILGCNIYEFESAFPLFALKSFS